MANYMTYDYKPGGCDLACLGIFKTWDECLEKCIATTKDHLDDETEAGELPRNQKELTASLPDGAHVWGFKDDVEADWWDGGDLGSRLYKITKHTVGK